MGRHRNNFDLIRLLAAAQVLSVHLIGHLQLPVPGALLRPINLFPGVAVFFVVSGFLVTQSFLESESISRYAWKRGLRIYPGLWANFLFIMALLYLGGAWSLGILLQPSFWQFQAAQFVIGSDFYGGYFAGGIYDWSHFYKFYPSGVLWTINVELGFYLIVPLVLWSRRWAPAAMIVAALASVGFAMLNAHWMRTAPTANTTALLNNGPLPYFWMFLIGAAARLYWPQISRFIEGRALLWLCVYVTASIALGLVFDVTFVNFTLFDGFALLQVPLLAAAVLAFAHSFDGLAARLLRGNDFSYGLYLYHMPVIATLAAFGIRGHWWLWVATPAIALTLAAASWFFIERPCLRLKAWRPHAIAAEAAN